MFKPYFSRKGAADLLVKVVAVWLGASSHLCNLSKPIKTISKPYFSQNGAADLLVKVAAVWLGASSHLCNLSKPYLNPIKTLLFPKMVQPICWCCHPSGRSSRWGNKKIPPQQAQQLGGHQKSPPQRAQQHTSTIIAERNVAPSHIAIPITGTSVAPSHPSNLLKPDLNPI